MHIKLNDKQYNKVVKLIKKGDDYSSIAERYHKETNLTLFDISNIAKTLNIVKEETILNTISSKSLGILVELYSAELTFLGKSNQPYRGKIWIQYLVNDKVIDNLSFKKYLSSLIRKTFLIEELTKEILLDFKKELKHNKIKITIDLTGRGGIQNKLEINGDDKYIDFNSNQPYDFPKISIKNKIKQM